MQVQRAIEKAKYGIAETEHTGEGEGTPHIQGYVYFDNQQTFSRMRILIGERAHLEKAKGSPRQNYDYCSKEGTVFASKPLSELAYGKKADFETFYGDIQNGMGVEEFQEKYPKIWFYQRDKVSAAMNDVAMKFAESWNGNLQDKNVWIWGETGLGKTRWAYSLVPTDQMLVKNVNKWWDGFTAGATKLVLIDEFPSIEQGGDMFCNHMKKWADRNPFSAECKGYTLNINPGSFFLVITSQFSIEECFRNPRDVRALQRKFREVQIKQGDLYSQCMVKLDTDILLDR